MIKVISTTMEAASVYNIGKEWLVVARKSQHDGPYEWVYSFPLQEMSEFQLRRDRGDIVTVQSHDGILYAKQSSARWSR